MIVQIARLRLICITGTIRRSANAKRRKHGEGKEERPVASSGPQGPKHLFHLVRTFLSLEFLMLIAVAECMRNKEGEYTTVSLGPLNTQFEPRFGSSWL